MKKKFSIEQAYYFVHTLRTLKDTERYTTNNLVKKRDVVGSHSWRAESFPLLLHDQFIKEGLNPIRVMEYLNLHDWVEIKSGEVQALGHRDDKAKVAMEVKMVEELKSQLGEYAGKLIKDFFDQKDKESRVAKALENLESNMHVIEEIEPIIDLEHRQRTIDYVTRRKGISNIVDELIDIQLKEIDRIVREKKYVSKTNSTDRRS